MKLRHHLRRIYTLWFKYLHKRLQWFVSKYVLMHMIEEFDRVRYVGINNECCGYTKTFVNWMQVFIQLLSIFVSLAAN